MKILIAGAGGNLGRRLTADFSPEHEVRGLTHADLDIADHRAVRGIVRDFRPDAVINAAAFTAVDRCEDEIDQAYAVNMVGARNLAAAAAEVGAKLVHYSTDFVFDGERGEPYREYDAVNPLSVYGQSKYAGEVEVRRTHPGCLILRVAWLYGPGGWNFTDWAAEQTLAGKEIRIVTDQFGCPTWVGDVSRQTNFLLEADARGLYHAVNGGAASRYEWALETARAVGGDEGCIQPITSDQFPQKAPRPRYSVLDNFVLRAQGLETMRPWKDALLDHLKTSAARK